MNNHQISVGLKWHSFFLPILFFPLLHIQVGVGAGDVCNGKIKVVGRSVNQSTRASQRNPSYVAAPFSHAYSAGSRGVVT